MKKFWDGVSRTWCENFHSAPTWPIHGRSRCRKCWRIIPVPWANNEVLTPPEPERRPRGATAPALAVRWFVEQ